jgi:hypothetical protein
MKGFGWRRDRQQSAAYCRRDNRVYRSCPLDGNWETCTLNCDCLLAGGAAPERAPATRGSSAGAPALARVASPAHGRPGGKAS